MGLTKIDSLKRIDCYVQGILGWKTDYCIGAVTQQGSLDPIRDEKRCEQRGNISSPSFS